MNVCWHCNVLHHLIYIHNTDASVEKGSLEVRADDERLGLTNHEPFLLIAVDVDLGDVGEIAASLRVGGLDEHFLLATVAPTQHDMWLELHRVACLNALRQGTD